VNRKKRETEMERIAGFFRELWKDESAEVAVEYGLLVALIALGLILVMNAFSTEVGNFFGKLTGRIATCPDVGGCQ
jgi:Flp pilus assembly pilin Flp